MSPALALVALQSAQSLMQFGQTMSAASLAKKESKLAAKQIRLASLSREADRKEALADATATLNARGGTSGVDALSGSPLSFINAMREKSEQESQRDEYMTKLAQKSERYRGKQRALGYQSQAMMSLLGGGIDAAQNLPVSTKNKGEG